MNLPTRIYHRAERILISIAVACLSAYGILCVLSVSRYIA